MRSIVSPLDGFASPFGPQRGFNPSRLFSNDEPGGWFENDDATTLFTDVAGTTPVTAPGDAVALQLDKSQGLVLGPELVTNGGFDADTDWTLTAGATISDGVLISGAVSPNTTFASASLAETLIAGRAYEISVDLVGFTSGGCFVQLAGGAALSTTVVGGPTGRKKGIFFATNSHTTVNLRTFGVGFDGTIDNISVRELPGNHRTQATTAARPLYALHPVGGVRNKLEYTEEFDNAVWTKAVATISANSATAPDDESTADKLVETTALGPHTVKQLRPANAGTYTVQVFLKAGERTRAAVVATKSSGGGTYSVFNLSTGQIDEEGTDFGADVAFVSNSITDVGDGWYLCIIKAELNSATDFGISVNLDNATSGSLSQTYTGDGTSGLFVWGAQLEEGSTATNYQRVGSFLDVSEEGKARRGRLWYNGTSHFMQTGTITPGTDKVQVFAGVRKLSDAARGILMEHGNLGTPTNGAFAVNAPLNGTQPQYVMSSGGTAATNAIYNNSLVAAPTTNILTGLGDISGDSAILRVDGVQEAISTTDQGTGNYLAYPLYFGARGGTSLFYNGYEDTSIIRFGPNLDDTTISKVESYVASKTPEPTL
jgi:hypothetical protein